MHERHERDEIARSTKHELCSNLLKRVATVLTSLIPCCDGLRYESGTTLSESNPHRTNEGSSSKGNKYDFMLRLTTP